MAPIEMAQRIISQGCDIQKKIPVYCKFMWKCASHEVVTWFENLFHTLHAGFCSWSDWGGGGDEQLSNFLTYSCEVLGFIYDIFTHPALTSEVQETPRCTAPYRLTLLAASPVMRHLNQSGQGGWLTFGSINCFVIWKLLSPWSRRWASLYQDTSRPEECFFFFPPSLKIVF